jgi:glycogen debranching enzyme
VGRRCPFDVRTVPFSTRGAWISLSPVTGLHAVADEIHLDSHVHGLHPVLRLQPEREGRGTVAEWAADATRFSWSVPGGGRIDATFDGPATIRLRGEGLSMRAVDPIGELTPFTGSYLFVDPVDGAAVLTSYETGRRYRIRSLSGELVVVGAEGLGRAAREVVLGPDHEPWEVEITESTSVAAAAPRRGFDDLLAENDRGFAAWVDRVAPWRDERTSAAELAAYTLWSATVRPQGSVTRETVLMSKHWMNRVWSWDHVFNALALADADPDLALDQFLLPFDHQDGNGAVPDSVGHADLLFNFVKPPVHGWAFRRLRSTLSRELTAPELRRVHDALARWSRHWLDHRRAPGRPLPCYQHGNDSGWDNATTFDRHRVVESPDLAAYLILQLDVLEDLGTELGLEVDEWTEERRRLTDALLDELWTPEGFTAVHALSGERSTGSSLLMLMPLVLGRHLPEDVRELMVGRLQQHLTQHGAATEPPASSLYEPDGYWRGPIWAPSTALLESGLRESGYDALADELSARFREMCETSGFAENFDALTGEGLRDRAYTWTAAVYLTLCAEAVRRSV